VLELRKGQLGWKAAEKDKSPGTASNQFHITVIELSTAGNGHYQNYDAFLEGGVLHIARLWIS
jgi:hypothetical protein